MTGVDLPFACSCGTVNGKLVGVSPTNGNRLECYCGDCRAAEAFATPNRAIPDGPVQLYQTTPAHIRIDAGTGQLAVFSLSPKGVLRWYANCCGTMLFNTLRNPKIAFAAVFTDAISDANALGPVRARANIQNGDGTSRNEGFGRMLRSFAKGAIPARFTGSWKNTPFFDPDTLEPVSEIYVLSKEERAAVTPNLKVS
ncbi:MAG: DUF6151 family protein [Tateyamaria sp.]|uniref:DUF6151 family protein n=1 Tax=Tateyamaria sp. TaxID=1929288 RepID=UPI00326E40BC